MSPLKRDLEDQRRPKEEHERSLNKTPPSWLPNYE